LSFGISSIITTRAEANIPLLAAGCVNADLIHFTGPVENNVYQFSALPWITFTHISHTDFGNREKAQPIFDWGKYHEREGKLMMPFAAQVHHAFFDGIHIGKLADKLQRYLDEE
jgi:chloramphenicol O-acetyltransferase type B